MKTSTPVAAYNRNEPRCVDVTFQSKRRARPAGTPETNAPIAPAQMPARLYVAKSVGRRGGSTSAASTACSVGRNTLTSPADGFSVPTTAMRSSGTNHVTPANPSPVAAIMIPAARRSVRSACRWARRPKPSVSTAEPTSVPVTIAPTWTGEKPIPVRYWASRTLTKPSAKPRAARTRRTRRVSDEDVDAVALRRAITDSSRQLRLRTVHRPHHHLVGSSRHPRFRHPRFGILGLGLGVAARVGTLRFLRYKRNAHSACGVGAHMPTATEPVPQTTDHAR